MRILFLDIDGVLNTSHSSKLPMITSPDIYKYSPLMKLHQFDKDCVTCLNKIVKATGAKVVISSSWRLFFPMEDGYGYKVLLDYIKSQGIEADIIGYTPEINKAPRGLEIQKWLEEHNDIQSFVILDDINDMMHLSSRLVQTAWKHGLIEKKHFEKAINILTRG